MDVSYTLRSEFLINIQLMELVKRVYTLMTYMVFNVERWKYSLSSLGEYIQMENIVYNLLNWQSADLTI